MGSKGRDKDWRSVLFLQNQMHKTFVSKKVVGDKLSPSQAPSSQDESFASIIRYPFLYPTTHNPFPREDSKYLLKYWF